ncbi:MAG: phage major capsid protein [Pseudomonadota bacterium]
MSEIKSLTRAQAQEKLAKVQGDMKTVRDQAKGDDGKYDFNKVTHFGDEVKGSAAVAEKFQQLNAEATEISEHVETLIEAEKSAEGLDAQMKGRRRFTLPAQEGPNGPPANEQQFKSLGERVTQSEHFKGWHDGGRSGSTMNRFEDATPSDFLAGSAGFDTIGRKALMATTSGYAPESIRLPGFVEDPARPIQLLDILPTGQTSQEAIKFMRETTRTHASAERAEGAGFAESTFAFTEESTPVQKITDSVPVTDEQLEDVPMIEGYINNRLSFGVRRRLDRQCLLGDGTAPNLRGILNTTGIQTRARGADSEMDAIYKMMTSIRLGGRVDATHIVMHSNDWQEARLERTTDGLYILGNPMDAGTRRLWGLPVVINDALTEGTALVGSFMPSNITLFERRGIDIQVGYVGDQFGQGRRTIRADMRAALAMFLPAGFGTVTGLNA